MDKKFTRRDLLKSAGLISSGALNDPMKAAFASLLTGIVNKAYAAPSSASTPRNYIMFQLINAPSRWTWEPICPYDDPSTIISNRNVACKLVEDFNSNYTTVEYEHVSINGINMPWLWQSTVPTVDGVGRNLSDLMDSMLMIRGVNVINPAHTGALDLQFRPSGISHTITAMTGDVSDRPIPFIGLQTSTNPYISKVQKSGVNSLSTSGNWLDTLLKPFNISTAGTFNTQVTSMESTLSQVFKNIETFLKDLNLGYATASESNKGALAMVKRDFSNLSSEFYNRRDKYRNLLKAATAPKPDSTIPFSTFEGINDRPVMVDGVDIRDTLKTNQSTFYINLMAEQFAVIEYSLVNQLTTSLAAGLRNFNGFNFDEHTVDPLTATYINNLWNRGFSACLLELIDQLKAVNAWDNTVVSIAGEFGRNPKGVGDGSDHSPQSTNITFFSGALKGNEVVGDTKRSSGNTTYPGTWGYMASNLGYGVIGLGHIAATTAQLLNVASPVTNSSSLVKVENGKFASRLSKAKLV